MQKGLRELPPDDRDFALGAFDSLPSLEDIPNFFELPFRIKDQGDTDKCSAYASCAVSEVQEGVELSPGYSFAASKRISGDIDAWGQDLRSAMKAHVKYGGLADIYDVNGSRDFSDWEDMLWLAEIHRKRSYFKVTGQYDHFDNLRASLVKYEAPIAVGIQFGYPLSQTHLEEVSSGFGHAMTVIGYVGTYLIVGNSYGKEAGDNGKHYVSRKVINHWVDRYGAFTFIDVDRDEAEYNLSHGIVRGDNWLVQMFKIFKSLWR